MLEDRLIEVKKEVCSDNDSDINDLDFSNEGFIELEIQKKEPDSNWIESLDDALWNTPIANVVEQDTSLTQTKPKLKSVKGVNFKRKPAKKSNSKTGKLASSILEAEYDWNGERWW